jgi:hypothetical protein
MVLFRETQKQQTDYNAMTLGKVDNVTEDSYLES